MDDLLEDLPMLEVLIDELHDYMEQGAEDAAIVVSNKINSIYELS